MPCTVWYSIYDFLFTITIETVCLSCTVSETYRVSLFGESRKLFRTHRALADTALAQRRAVNMLQLLGTPSPRPLAGALQLSSSGELGLCRTLSVTPSYQIVDKHRTLVYDESLLRSGACCG